MERQKREVACRRCAVFCNVGVYSGRLPQCQYRTCGLIGEEPNKLLCYLAAVSRKTDAPLAGAAPPSCSVGEPTCTM